MSITCFTMFTIKLIPFLASSSLVAPITTILPDENNNIEHSFNLRNMPGNFSGLYRVLTMSSEKLLNVMFLNISIKLISLFKICRQVIFSILISLTENGFSIIFFNSSIAFGI